MRITTDELGVVAFVLPGAPNRTFELTEWPDGSFSLEPVAGACDPALLAAARVRSLDALAAVVDLDSREARPA